MFPECEVHTVDARLRLETRSRDQKLIPESRRQAALRDSVAGCAYRERRKFNRFCFCEALSLL